MQSIADTLAAMTLEEKAALCSGQDFWKTRAFDHLDIPVLMLADGLHGLRKQPDGPGADLLSHRGGACQLLGYGAVEHFGRGAGR